MALLDSVIQEVAERFGLGKRSTAFVAETVKFIFNEDHGSLPGFIEKFRKAGLGDLVSSWVAKGRDNLPLSPGQLESAIGNAPIQRMGSKFSVAGGTVKNALAFAIPRLVDLLTPDGVVPDKLPADLQSFLNSPAALNSAKPAATSLEAFGEDNSGLGPLGWLAAALWAGLLGYWAISAQHEPVVREEVAVVENVLPVEPQASLPARLALSNVDGKVEYSGVVHDENTRSSVVDVLRSVFGAGNISGTIDVNSRVGPATWLPRLGALLSKFTLPGADVVLEGNGLKVGGWLSDAERSSWLDSIKGLFGGDFSFGFLGDKTSDAVKSAYSRTLAAIDSLQPGYGGKELVDALNLWVVNFDTDSAQVPTDDDTRLLIAKAARAIRQNPEQVLIVISGHTDNTGDEARNKQLSEERAYAVRDALVAAGVPVEKFEIAAFGSDKPLASNDTPYGRFKNRRIEFSVKR